MTMKRILLLLALGMVLVPDGGAQQARVPQAADTVNGPGSTLSQKPRPGSERASALPYGLQLLARPDLLPVLRDTRCVMDSSFDRSGGNGDAGNFLRREGDRAVLADIRGPGCIYRIWSANATGQLQIFLDGETKPRIDCPMQDLFLGKVVPFVAPLVGKKSGGWYCFFPIPFQKACRIEVVNPGNMYYHVQYQLFPDNTRVRTFTSRLTPEDRRALQVVQALWNAPGREFPPPQGSPGETSGRTSCAPGATRTLEVLEGPGVITLLRMKITPADRFTLRQTLLRITWDDARSPAVLSPLGDFFGTGFGLQQFVSLPLAMSDTACSAFWPMPFRKRARIEIVNTGTTPLTEVIWKVSYQRLPRPMARAGYFHAQWRRQTAVQGQPITLLHTKGRGHFVGAQASMQGDHGLWFLEGDEQIYVDGEAFPSIYGTGSEDYYTGGWYFDEGPFHLPLHGCIVKRDDLSRVSAYRYQIPDCVPFQKEILVNIEHGGTNDYPGADYATVAYWYQDTPEHEGASIEFAQLTPATFRVAGVLEAEALSWSGSRVVVKEDRELPAEASGGKVVQLTGEGPTATFQVMEEDVYSLRIVQQALPETTYRVRVAIDGNTAEGLYDFDQGNVGDLKPGDRWEATLPVRLRPGSHTLSLTPDAGKVIALDYIKLDPSRKEKGVLEAEAFEATAQTIGGRVIRLDTGEGWSGNSGLIWYPEQENATLTFPVTLEADGNYALELGVVRDASTPVLGVQFNDVVLDTRELAQADGKGTVQRIRFGRLTDLKAGTHTLTLICRGRPTGVTQPALQLDFLHLRRSLYPHTLEGESLKVLSARDGTATRQGMAGFGSGWSDDEQFWFLGSKQGAEATLELPVEKAGRYELSVYYTTAKDYAIVQVLVNDQPIGPPTDCYTPEVKARGKVTLGIIELPAGNHRITFRAVGKNPASSNYLIGVDAIGLKPEP